MSKLLKDVYTNSYLESVAREIKIHYKEFKTDLFLDLVFASDWKELELKMRMKRITQSLHQALPKDYREAIDILTKAAPKFSGFEALFFPDFIEAYGKDKKHFNLSLSTLEILTKYSSSEFAIRAFILEDEARVMKKMLTWSKSKNYHVRRLASEGCRSRLPWAMALNRFKESPNLILPILENLKNDPELYVRKSVANNLNDISKDHPEIVLDLAKKWYGKSAYTDWIVKHGLRTLLKSGNPSALKIFGYNNSRSIQVQELTLITKKVKIGSNLNFKFLLNIIKRSRIRIEYKIYYLKSNGSHSSKVFKITEGDFEKEVIEINKKQSFKEMTTRKHYKGEHFLSIVINGIEKEKVRFEVI